MSLSVAWGHDWRFPYPFRWVQLSTEVDSDLGQVSLDVAILGLSVSVTWVYDPETETRQLLAERMDDMSWLEKSRVSMSFDDYKALKEDADKWRESQNGTGREKAP